jgi:hypothetical protein
MRQRGRFVCEIVDRGNGFDDPGAGYLAPRNRVGTGLWVARQLTWRIEVLPVANRIHHLHLALATIVSRRLAGG